MLSVIGRGGHSIFRQRRPRVSFRPFSCSTMTVMFLVRRKLLPVNSGPQISGFKLFHVFTIAIFISFTFGTDAHALHSNWVGDKRVAVRLITASDSTSGDALLAGLEFRYEPGWHGYWRTPGDAGIAPRFNW